MLEDAPGIIQEATESLLGLAAYLRDYEPKLDDFDNWDLMNEIQERDLEDEILDDISSSRLFERFDSDEIIRRLCELHPGMRLDVDELKYELESVLPVIDDPVQVRQCVERLCWSILGRII